MKKIFIILLVLLNIFVCTSCKNETELNTEPEYKIALVCDMKYMEPEAVGVEIYNSIESFYTNVKFTSRKFHPQSTEQIHILQTIEGAISDGYNVISVIGNEFGNAASSIATEYPHITFVIFGMSDAIALHTNVYCSNLDIDYLEFYKSILK